MRLLRTIPLMALGVSVSATPGCGRDALRESSRTDTASAVAAAGAVVNPALDTDESSWVRAAKDYASWPYSTLPEITTMEIRAKTVIRRAGRRLL